MGKRYQMHVQKGKLEHFPRPLSLQGTVIECQGEYGLTRVQVIIFFLFIAIILFVV